MKAALESLYGGQFTLVTLLHDEIADNFISLGQA